MAKTIITLGREYCTGGRYIAKDVARALGIKLYDKELITMAAKNSGLSEEAVAASEKRHTHSLLYSLYTMGNDLPLGDQVFILQSRIIKQLADEGPCVIVGRCGDYVLRDRKDVLRIFVYAPRSGVWLTARRTICCRPRTKRASRTRSTRPIATVPPTTTTTPRTAGAMPTTMTSPSTPHWAMTPA